MSKHNIKLKKINEHKITPYITSKMNPDDVLGGDIAPVPYCNVLLVAETNSGKTSALGYLLKHCAGSALIVAFVPTIDDDESWVKIRKELEDRGNTFVGFSNMEEDGVDRLKELLDMFLGNPLKEHPKHKGKICPRLVVIMDDMSRYLKHPTVAEFMKNGRHAKAKFIISTQNIHAVLPEALRQVRQWFIFRGLPDEKIKKIKDDAGIPTDLDTLIQIYKTATVEPYSFLLINKNGADFEYRSNFDHLIEI